MAADGYVVRKKLRELLVVDLKAELEKRDLDKNGVKAVLVERLQKALKDEGCDPDEYLFEVQEVSPVKKTKRTNKKLSRDDESETQSNLDESHDLTLDDEEKESEDEPEDKPCEDSGYIMGEDAINLSVEEEEKLLTEEDEMGDVKDGKVLTEKEDFARSGREEEIRAGGGKALLEEIESCSDEKSGRDERKRALEQCDDNLPLIVDVDRVPTDLDADSENRNQKKQQQQQQQQQQPQQQQQQQVGGEDETKKCGDRSSVDAAVKGEEADGSGGKVGVEADGAVDGKKSEEVDPIKVKMEAAEPGSGDATEKSNAGSSSAVKSEKKENGEKPPSPNSKTKSTPGKNKTAAKDDKDKKVRVSPGSSRNLWVSGLSSTTRATDLKTVFSKYGKVLGAKVVTNARTPGTRCYGFVTMASSEEASKCIQHLHKTELHGRMISVEKAKNEPSVPLKKTETKTTSSTTKKAAPKENTKSEPAKTSNNEVKKNESESGETKKESTDEKKVEEKNSKKESEEKEKKTESKSGSKEGDSRKKSKERESGRSSAPPRRNRDTGDRRGVTRGPQRIFPRRPFVQRQSNPILRRAMMLMRKPPMMNSHNLLTFKKIKDEQLRQREREREREMREAERRRQQEMFRQREIERKQREEAIRLERERERLRIEREKLEREKAEVLRLEREKQRLERERIEREREDLRRREHFKVDDHRRSLKRPFEGRGSDGYWDDRKRMAINVHGRRDRAPYESRVSASATGPVAYKRDLERFERRDSRTSGSGANEGSTSRSDVGRFDESVRRVIGRDRDDRRVIERSSGARDVDRFSRAPQQRDADLRSRERDDRTVSIRDVVRRPQSRDEWKTTSQDKRGHDISRVRYEGGNKMISNSSSSFTGGNSRSMSDSWHGSGNDHRGTSKPYSSGGMISGTGRDQWNSDRKVESSHGQSWSRSEGQNDRWSGGISGGGLRSQQGMSMSTSLLNAPQSSVYSGNPSGNASGIIMNVGSGSYSSDRYDSYKGVSSTRRY